MFQPKNKERMTTLVDIITLLKDLVEGIFEAEAKFLENPKDFSALEMRRAIVNAIALLISLQFLIHIPVLQLNPLSFLMLVYDFFSQYVI